MKILEQRVLRGPNVYHNRPVIVTRLDLQEKADVGSHQRPEFSRKLAEFLPGLVEHHCSPGHRGGFLERLERGTYFGHIVEHVALELSGLAGIDVSYGKTVYAGSPGEYLVVTRFLNEEGMKRLIEGAVALVDALEAGQGFDLETLLTEAREIIADTALGPSTKAIVEAAERRRIPWRRIGEGSLIELGYGKNRRRIQAAVSNNTGLIATDLVQDKDLTKKVLKEAFLPVPSGRVARAIEDGLAIFEARRKPLAVKPLNGHHGKGVSLNIDKLEDFERAFGLAKEYDREVLIEEMRRGRDYRVLVIDGKLAAAAERLPAHVIGDGESSVGLLIEIANRDPRRGDGHMNTLTRLEYDEAMERCLKRQNLALEIVPAKSQIVWLRENANLSSGGIAKDVTAVVHPKIRSLCERAARIVGLDICGIDLIHTDIALEPDRETAIIEVNAGPGLRMHIAPSEGEARDVGGMIVDSVYPPGTTARIPIAAVTGTNGKTTTTRLIGHILSKCGLGRIGMTSSDGITIGGEVIETGDTTGPLSSRAVLSEPTVDAAVLEVDRGGLLRGGLAYDWSDVGVITNIRPDHIGQDGIEDIEDIVRIKSLVAERVRDGGTIVLNADDLEASQLMERPRMQGPARNVVYYSLSFANQTLRHHLAAGGRAFYAEGEYLYEAEGKISSRLAKVSDLPFTLKGAAAFQVSNALAALAAARAMGVPAEAAIRALMSFQNGRQNLGRMNLYRVGRGYLIMDYAHNPDAISAIANFVKATGKRSTAILGLPGDRANVLIEESAKIAAEGFDRIIVREDRDRRGRAEGELPAIIERALKAAAPEKNVEVIPKESEALARAIDQVMEDEVIVFLYDEYGPAMQALKDFDPAPVESLDSLLRMPERRAYRPASETSQERRAAQ